MYIGQSVKSRIVCQEPCESRGSRTVLWEAFAEMQLPTWPVYVHIEHLIGEKAFANDIAFIEIEQWEGDNENQIELYNLKPYIDFEMYN